MDKLKELKEFLSPKKFFLRIGNYFVEKEGGKNRFRFDRMGKVLAIALGPLSAYYVVFAEPDSSYVGRSPTSLYGNERKVPPKTGHQKAMDIPVQRSGTIVGGSQPKTVTVGVRHEPAKLMAKQVILRDLGGLGYGFSVGSNIVGELQSTIDTRDANQLVRVALPFGARSKDGSTEIPKGTLLMGKVNYPGKGEKVFVSFVQAVFPEGKSVKLAAQALDPKDYSSGLSGDIQSQAKTRALSIAGLSMVQAMGSVMTEKEALGQGFQVTPK
ncbi:MAG: hypothetical protein K2X47_16110, partial [Bdellovibrionales bacterium]|nr:hypothetical protein [Bdellovibrionales bacterium]